MGLLRINELAPVASTISYAGETPPEGWLICDGSAISRSEYADLFGVLGETFGAGDGSTTFNLPDLETRVAVGKGTGKTLGSKGGAMNMTPSGSLSGGAVSGRTLCNQQLPAHDHGGGNHAHNQCTLYWEVNTSRGAGYAGGFSWQSPASSGTIINSCGLGCSHDHAFVQPSFSGDSMSVEQPYTVLNYIIKH